MAKSKTGNSKFLKKYNETGILDLIRINKSISRAELSRISGLSPTATGIIVSNLIKMGYVYETATGESIGGRKPVLLELKPGSFYSVGVDLDIDYIRMVIVDITGKIYCDYTSNMPGARPFKAVIDQIQCLLEERLTILGITNERILGIGIAIPGIVDDGTHRIVLAPNMGWKNVEFGAGLNRMPGIPVYIENEARASAICENWLGCCRDINDFVCINIKSGIGAGIFTNGRLYRGKGGSGGEVGHIVVDESGPKCACGNYGCVEAMASTVHIVDNAKKLVRQGVASTLNSISNVEDITFDVIVEAALKGDEASRNILLESARYLGIAISYLVNILNPSRVVLGKEFVKYSGIVLERIKSIVDSKALKFAAADVEVMASEIGEKASAVGAAIIPLKVLFGK